MYPCFLYILKCKKNLKQYTTCGSSHTSVDTQSEISDCSVTSPSHVEHEIQSKQHLRFVDREVLCIFAVSPQLYILSLCIHTLIYLVYL